MKTVKGPAIFLAQFAGDEKPYNNLEDIARWAAGLGFKGIQIPSWDKRLFDLKLAAESQAYCDQLLGMLHSLGLELTELSTHLQGQLVAVHPAFDLQFDGFAPPGVAGNPKARQEWATQQLRFAAKASRNLKLAAHATFSGALAWPYVYPWPQRPAGLIDEAFAELGRRWKPILDVFEEQGIDLCYEIHPGEDLHDGVTFERFLAAVGGHKRANILYDPSHFVLQQLDYLAFIDIYHERIRAFHVKDAEFHATGRSGVYGGYQDWIDRPGRFRSLGDGQVDFGGIFSKLAQYNFPGWAVMEWECALKHPEDGAREGAPFISKHIIRVTEHAFDDFASGQADVKPIAACWAFEGILPARRKPEPLDEAALYQYAVGALGRQMRTVAELKRLMTRKVEEGEAGEKKMAAVVARLADQHYLDDRAFASTYTRLRQENQSFGKRRVQQELTRKGVQSELVTSTLEAAYEQISEPELVRHYLARKRIARPEDEKQTARVVRRLVAAGFSFPVIAAVLKNWEIDVALPEDDEA